MSKQSMREEAEQLIREATIAVKQGDTRIDAVCGKCGGPNRIKAPKGQTRVAYVCKQCGQEQTTL